MGINIRELRAMADLDSSEETSSSIVYNPQADRYDIKESIDLVGVMVGDLNDYISITSNQTEALTKRAEEKFGPCPEGANYKFRCHLRDSNLTGIDTLLITVSIKKVVNELPYGVFVIKNSNYSLIFKRMPKEEKKPLLNNPFKLSQYLEELKAGSFGRKCKKGVLLYGPPGTGKTSSIFNLRDYCTEENRTRMFFIANNLHLSELNDIRELFKDDYIIFVLEEVTERIDKFGAQDILTFLDGENSWNNSLVIATTNYPEDLEANVVDRPGRLDTFIEFKYPTKEDIQNLAGLFNITEDLSFLFGKELSYDYLSYIFDQSVGKKLSVKEVYEKEKEVRKKISQTFKSKSGIGLI